MANKPVMGTDSEDFLASYQRAVLLFQQGRTGEALVPIAAAIKAKPGEARTHLLNGLVLLTLERFADALASYDQVVALRPDLAEAWNNRGTALQRLQQGENALASFDKALALKPNYPGALLNRGIVLSDLARHQDALTSFDKFLAFDSDDANVWNRRGVTLQTMGRLAEAVTSYEKAVALQPDFAGALSNLGSALFENDRIEEGCAAFTRHARLVFEDTADDAKPIPPHKARHDQEQQDYLAGRSGGFHLGDGEKLAGPAVNPKNAPRIAAEWPVAQPKIVVIDDFLNQEALQKLRRFCWDSTVWRNAYDDGYLGALPQHGLACPLLAQIAAELRSTFPAIFGEHPLRYLWGFKYDSQLSGIKLHADKAAVNVNFWITPDEANLDPESGGLVIWDVAVPADWGFHQYNGDTAAIRDFLVRNGARSTVVPYRANRVVIFDSDLFHETDKIRFKDGYLNRRINITLLYSRRGENRPES